MERILNDCEYQIILKDIKEIDYGAEQLLELWDSIDDESPTYMEYSDYDIAKAIVYLTNKLAESRIEQEQDYKLCYIDGNQAFFTDNFEEQWGDDWNDAPYEHNAGDPYKHYYKDGKEYPINLVEVYFSLPRYWNYLPCDYFTNSPYSVEAINKGAIAWVHTDDFNIQAGTSLKEFIDTIKKHGGKIFLEQK